MVVPMPTALPCTAAISGFFALPRFPMKRNAGLSSLFLPLACAAKSARSLPAVKLSPSPWNSTTLMALSVSARSRLSDSASYIAPVSAFFFSGRCNVRTRMPSVSSAFTCSFIGCSPYKSKQDLNRNPSGDGASHCFTHRTVQESGRPLANDVFGIGHGAIDQLLDGRDVIDQSDHHAAAPGARIHLAVDHHLGIDAGHLIEDVVDLERPALFPFYLDQAFDALVLQHPLGVAKRAHDQPGVQFGRIEDGLLDVVMDRRLLSRDETSSHVDTAGTERERGDQAPRIGHAA